MQVKSIAECSKGSILQYFQPSISYHLSLRSLFCLFLSGRFTHVFLYVPKSHVLAHLVQHKKNGTYCIGVMCIFIHRNLIYNTPHYITDLDIAGSCCGYQIFDHGILKRNYRKMTYTIISLQWIFRKHIVTHCGAVAL